ncbi:hypothetical protein, partial [Caballeronia sp. GACF5]|uniref:hypothetical protein n=1 Tax=Caballeronia sp. GACF5 TaxID=2921746 RepID=UPI0020283FE9
MKEYFRLLPKGTHEKASVFDGQQPPSQETHVADRLPLRRLPPGRKARTANRCGARLGRHSHLSRYDQPVVGLALELTEKRGTDMTFPVNRDRSSVLGSSEFPEGDV